MTMKVSSKVKLFATLIAMGAVVLSPVVASAATDSKDTTVTVTVGGTISLTTSTNVSISLTPTSGGVYSSNSDTVTVTTNNSAGYTVTMKDKDTNTDLVGTPSGTFTTSTGTTGTPAALTAGTWGWAVVGGAFDGSYTAETNTALDSSKWAGVPASSGSAVTIADKNAAAPSGEVTTVWYGAAANTSQPSGSYVDTVTYTAATK